MVCFGAREVIHNPGIKIQLKHKHKQIKSYKKVNNKKQEWKKPYRTIAKYGMYMYKRNHKNTYFCKNKRWCKIYSRFQETLPKRKTVSILIDLLFSGPGCPNRNIYIVSLNNFYIKGTNLWLTKTIKRIKKWKTRCKY